MNANKIIMIIMAIGFVIGGIDKIIGNKFGLAKKFEEGIQFLGTATMSMAGLLCLVPVFSGAIRSLLDRIGLGGMDPAMAASVLGINMGGYSLAVELAEDALLGKFSGVIVSSMLGAAITFTIPVGLSIIQKEDRGYFARGLMIGLIPVPVGCFVAGWMMKIPFSVLLVNEIPVLILAVFLILGLYFIPDKMTVGFVALGRTIQILALAGLILAGFIYISGFNFLPAMQGLLPAMSVICGMCVLMAGSFTVMEIFMNFCRSRLEKAGSKVGLNAMSISGMLFSFISLLPVFAMMKDMNSKGKTVCTAFFVGSTCVFGGHLSYVAAEAPDFMVPMIVGKLVAAVLGALLALMVERKGNECE